MNIYEQIRGRAIYAQVAKGLTVRISLRELQVSMTNWARNQIQYAISITSETNEAVVLKFKGEQDILAEKVAANNQDNKPVKV